jgi:hypothetical protein
MTPFDEAAIVWTIRLSLLLYVAGILSLLLDREGPARALWTAGVLSYLAHAVSAFHRVHGWSHEKAVLETARQTEELLGVSSGAGLYFNYLFTLVWTADALWWWIDPDGYRRRPRWTTFSVHLFLAFMFFNGAVVFADGFSRWVGLASTPPLLFLYLRSRAGPRARC